MDGQLAPLEPWAVAPVGLLLAAHVVLDVWAARGKAQKAAWLGRFNLVRWLLVSGALFMTICLPFGLGIALVAQLALVPARYVAAKLLGYEAQPLAPGVVAMSIVIVAVLASGEPAYLRTAIYLVAIAWMLAAAPWGRRILFDRDELDAFASARLDTRVRFWLGAVCVAGGVTGVALSEAIWLWVGLDVWIWLYAFRYLFTTLVNFVIPITILPFVLGDEK